MQKQRGFTLIEMMIVVGIIAIIAAIALPNLLRSKVQANEASAIENLRQVGAAQVTHHGARQRFGDFASLTFPPDGPPGFMDDSWVEGVMKNGYVYTIPEATGSSFTCLASPETPGVSGFRYFRIDTSGIVRYSAAGVPAPDATPVGQ